MTFRLPPFPTLSAARRPATALLTLLWLTATVVAAEVPATDHQTFSDYWYGGKAELNRYKLEQARYGQIHQGDSVLIFVTEDFLKKEQVKRDRGKAPADTVLKLNAMHHFNTGIYTYSLMTSSFTTVDYRNPFTHKVAFTGQDWCGHTFMQLNQRDEKYRVQVRSYFQGEGDKDFALPTSALLEDRVWTQIRIAPASLPTGRANMVPSLQFSRLRHVPAKAQPVDLSLEKVREAAFGTNELYRYRIDYPELKRTVEIYFQTKAPYRIEGWRDTRTSGFGSDAKPLTTTAIRTHTVQEPYWRLNRVSDLPRRESLGLTP